MHAIRIALAAALVAAAGAAAAQAPAYPAPGPAYPPAFVPSSYLQLRLGIYSPQGDLDGFNTGFAIDGAYGYRFTPNLAAELQLGYFVSKGDTVNSGGVTVEPKFSGVPITANLKGILPVSPTVDLYGLVGLGLYFVSLGGTGSVSGQSATVTFDDTAFGVQLGGGASFALTPAVFLSADLRYMIAKASFSGAEGNVDGLFVSVGVGTRL